MIVNTSHYVIKSSLDVLGIAVAAGTLFSYLPTIAAIIPIVWYGLQIGERIYYWVKKWRKNSDR